MSKVPGNVRQFISNAKYYLEAAGKIPQPTQDAAHILLLIIGWENLVRADKELEAWAQKKQIDPKIIRDHAAKLGEVGEHNYISRVIVGPPGQHIPVVERTIKQVLNWLSCVRYASTARTTKLMNSVSYSSVVGLLMGS